MRRGDRLVVVLFLAALAVRLAPLLLSPLPYNVDGFAGARAAEDLQAEAWRPDTYELSQPGAWAALAAFSALSGLDPLHAAQPLFAFVGAASVLVAAALTRRVTGSATAAVGAAAFAAFYGFFVFFTTATMKENMGLLLLALVALGLSSPRRSERGMAYLLAAATPLYHHLTAVVVILVVATFAILPWFLGRGRILPLVLTGLLATEAAVWFRAMAPLREFLATLSADAIILAATFALVLLVLAILVANPRDPRRRAAALAALPLTAAGIAGLASLRAVFPLTPTTPPGMLPYLAAAGVALATSAVGIALLLSTGRSSAVVAASLLAGPLAFLAFALLRGLDVASFELAHRAADYADIAGGMGFGVAFAWLAKSRRFLPVAAGLVALVAGTAGFPLAGAGTFPLDNITTPAEASAAAFAVAHVRGDLETDSQYGEIMSRYHERAVSEDVAGAVAAGRLETASLVSPKWIDWGIVRWPLAPVAADGAALGRLSDSANVVYVTGPSGVALLTPGI